MNAEAEILFLNESFYHVFRQRDLTMMARLWADRLPVACAHPGWPAISGREEVLGSWQAILTNPDAPDVSCHGAQAFVCSRDSAFVICYEKVGDSVLVATNFFAREAGEWRMVHHQAGPCNVSPLSLDEEPEAGPLQ